MKQTVVALMFLCLCHVQGMADTQVVTLLEGEQFWGGCVTDGRAMPFGQNDFERDLYGSTQGNQAQPLLISDQGRYIWCEEPFKFTFSGRTLKVESRRGEIQTGQQGDSLREVFQYVSRTFFPSIGQIPDERLFIKPQYNTWIELIYDQREDRIRKYANDILANGFPAGVLMIDDNWQEDYGIWDFHPGRFSDPKAMMNTLHDQGFQVMLWICPYFSPDSETFRLLNKKGYFLKDRRGGTYMRRWWNGYSASLDLTNPEAVTYFQGRLAYLVNHYGVDGFKLDAGDADHYHDQNIKAAQDISPNAFSELWARLGLPFTLNEYRACWKMAGQPLAQRLRDKGHTWQDLRQLIPDALALGLMGYAYVCPDLIGGGEYSYFYNNPDKPLDQELIVRSAQCSTLMPMMQFSVAPWRVLSKENMAICRDMARLHEKLGPEILAMAQASSTSGEPMVRTLEYQYPHQGYAAIKDQFLLGDSILVAPVLEKGKRTRNVVFPAGTWQGDDGFFVVGPCMRAIEVPLARLPWYRLVERLAQVEQTANSGPFSPSWESLAKYEIPTWYQDAKFGIFIHWGAYSVPAFGNEWYPREMYNANKSRRGIYQHHLKTYGDPSEFGYKDFIPLFKAEKFDATQWAKLFKDAGAKYVIPVAEHHDGFPMYDSDYTEWNAANMGPKRDVIGELAKAIRKQGLTFGLSSHRVENWWFYGEGRKIKSDVTDEKYRGLYGPARDKEESENGTTPPDAAFLQDWLLRCCELVDKYQPQVIWFDWWIAQPAVQPYLKTFSSYYYNQGAAWNKGVAINYKKLGGESFPDTAGVLDIERGGLAEIRDLYWQTDTSVSKTSWGYVTNHQYKTVNSLIDDLVDIVSKNGCMLLNIGPRADGTIPEQEQDMLRKMGGWLSTNGEAIYSTRPWHVFGEGPTRVEDGTMANDAEHRRSNFVANDIRFTTAKDALYAIGLEWPENRQVIIKSLAKEATHSFPVTEVRLLGHRGLVTWEQTNQGLVIQMPESQPCDYAFTLKIYGAK